ncbi:hypothetical protein SAMN06295909_3080 [Plantibacter sp. VKM Ac-1784]|uniref:Insertion element IS150 protein InsJ-like helix-turn-helix domain-containing protein n=1 Tax=Plantibacter elymi (nom. nud.) TaxID=199708 RepID=A0ABY1RFN7_9MICO|nr:helix-turn-helix domain-containing protein [Plantibacter sp. VKM Ac-1784]SMQ73092.1 hypothetical protein SAMN06295909_3080 [Plantibacter sp. VKM Ac-1784]
MTAATVTKTLDVVTYLDGKWWTFEIPALTTDSPRGAGHRIVAMGSAKRFKDIAAAARDVAALWLDLDDYDGDVVVTVRDEAVGLWSESNTLEEQARQQVREAARKRREAVLSLIAKGASQSDAAAVFGVSVQRVSQLVH